MTEKETIKTDNHCSLAYCHNQLETPDELDMGLCARHARELKSDYYTSLICWACSRVLETYHRRDIIRGVEIPSRYLFVKACPFCNEKADKNQLSFMTIDESPALPPTLI